jgi:predicted RNase H-like HicB family nuclease
MAEGVLGDVFAAAGGALIAPPYDITLERGSDGTYLGWVNDLPGCALRGSSRDDVVRRLPAAIAEFLAWTGATDVAPPAVAVVDEIDSMIKADEDTEALLAVDRDPLTEERWAEAERWLQRSREELIGLLDRLTDEELGSRREGSSRSVREEIEHLAFVELMYVAWTFDLQSRAGLAEFLGWTRAVAGERMTALAGDHNADLTSARWGGAPRPEPWTARKAARRLVWHELLHLRAIERFVES